MLRVDARGIPTEVVKVQPLRNRTHQPFEIPSVGGFMATAEPAALDAPVATGISVALPFPTSGFRVDYVVGREPMGELVCDLLAASRGDLAFVKALHLAPHLRRALSCCDSLRYCFWGLLKDFSRLLSRCDGVFASGEYGKPTDDLPDRDVATLVVDLRSISARTQPLDAHTPKGSAHSFATFDLHTCAERGRRTVRNAQGLTTMHELRSGSKALHNAGIEAVRKQLETSGNTPVFYRGDVNGGR